MTKTSSQPQSSQTRFDPIVKELTPAPSVEESFLRFRRLPGCLLLDSSMRIPSPGAQPLGRYSFLMAEPFDVIIEPVESAAPFDRLRESLSMFSAVLIPNLPPMQGGVAGLFSFDLNRSIETIAKPKYDEFQIPAVAAGIYDTVIAWDHEQNRAWIISQGFPERDFDARRERANGRTLYFESLINSPSAPARSSGPAWRELELAPSFSVEGPEGLTSSFSRANYMAAVQKCIDYIHAGDVFQINLAQRLMIQSTCCSSELYLRLRKCSPAPFSAFFDISQISDTNAQIISASPERLFSVRDRFVETRPIKGTRKRTGRPMVDIHAKQSLHASEKDRAENVMIVDLMRNDLSRVCEDNSICVTQLCELEQYHSVMHLVSAVQGKLKPECGLADLLAAVFPGGSITGAPKIRAMEIISELEPSARGAYCGALGYLGFGGSADLNILIRTITASQGWWQIPVGGGIVSQSNPQREYEETWTKAAGMLRAVTMKET